MSTRGTPVDYTLEVHEPDENGIYFITSSVPGLCLAGTDLARLFADVPRAVALLREKNGDERHAHA